MKTAFAIVLICITAPLSAGERCTKAHAHRTETARPLSAKPVANRAGVERRQKVISIPDWQRALLFEPQIL